MYHIKYFQNISTFYEITCSKYNIIYVTNYKT